MTRRRILTATLIVLLGLATTVAAQPFSAQIQAALRAFLRAAHTWTATQTFADVVINGTCTGPGCASSSFTSNVTITKADPAVVFDSTTAGDTDYVIADCDDGGGDNDDPLTINATTTPCAAQPLITAFQDATTGGFFRYFPESDEMTFGLEAASLGSQTLALSVIGNSNNRRLVLNNGGNTTNCLTLRLNFSERWNWGCTTGHQIPAADNASDLGSTALRTRTVYAGTSVNVAASGNATLRNGAVTVANVGADSCGTTAATIVGNNSAGKVTVGATSGTVCRVTFTSAWSNAPACVVTNETTANLSRATSTTTTVDLAGTFVGGDVLAYQCLGY